MNRCHDLDWVKRTLEIDSIALRCLTDVDEQDARCGHWHGQVPRFQGIRVFPLLYTRELESMKVMTT